MTIAAQILSATLLGVSTVELSVEAIIVIYCLMLGVKEIKKLLSN